MTSSARPLGLWSATALVVGNMIGSGVFLLPASLAQYGSASILGWTLSTVGAVLLAVVFARLGQRYPVCGGPYAFSRLAFGDSVGFLIAWSYWISVWCSVAAIAVAFAGSMTSLAPQWFSTPGQSAMCAIGVLWFCTVLNLVGMRAAGVAQVVLTILKLLPLVAVIVLGVRAIDLHNYVPFNPSGEGLLGVTTTTGALALWALLGLECATIPADHVVDAERTVPRATILGVAIGAIVTVAVCMIAIGLVPLDALKNSPAPFADAAQRFAGPAASVVMAAAMAVSCLGALNGWILVQGQIPLAAARDKLFPAVFARIDRNETPRVGLVIGSVLATLLVIANFDNSLVGIFTASILLATAAALLPYLVCAAALWRLEPSANDARTWRRIAAALAFMFSAWALIGTGAQALEWGAGLLLAGLPVYALMRWRPS